MAVWKASTDSGFAAKVPPGSLEATSAPTAEMPTRPATRAIALLIADAIAASVSSASASTVAVSVATGATSPSEKTTSAGRRSSANETSVSTRRKSRIPAAASSEPRVDHERLQVRDREVPAAEQIEPPHRVGRATLVDHEHLSATAPPASEPITSGLPQPKRGCSTRPEDDSGQTDRAEHRAEDVDATPHRRSVGYHGAQEEQRDEDERVVEREDPAPRGPVDNHAAGERADDDRYPAPGGPRADRRAASAVRERRRDDRQRARRHQRPSDTLQRPGRDQRLRARRDRAGKREDAEGTEHAPPAVDVTQRTPDQDQ
jgi:hypothetical protein